MNVVHIVSHAYQLILLFLTSHLSIVTSMLKEVDIITTIMNMRAPGIELDLPLQTCLKGKKIQIVHSTMYAIAYDVTCALKYNI